MCASQASRCNISMGQQVCRSSSWSRHSAEEISWVNSHEEAVVDESFHDGSTIDCELASACTGESPAEAEAYSRDRYVSG